MGYLVISRKVGQRILIGPDIEILISALDSMDKTIDVAIKAPKHFKIWRKDTHIKEEQKREFKHHTD